MKITFRQLTVFDAVARHLSFTRASEELYLSQPAVSMQVKQMESAIGLPLFETLGKRIHLTEAGEVMHGYAAKIAEQLAEAQQALDEIKGVEGGRLRVTVATTVNYFASRLLSTFCQRYPRVQVHLDITNRQTLLRRLDANETDIVLMGQPPEEIDVISQPFMDNPLVVIASPQHTFARKKKKITLAELEQETFLLREPGSGTRTAMHRFFAEHDLKPSSSVEMTSNEAIKQSVEAGLGLGIVSRHTVELELEVGRLTLLNVEAFPIMRRWFVVHRKGKRLSAVAETFREFVLSEADQHHHLPAQGSRKSTSRDPQKASS